jgi:hypothetical protein
LSLKALRAFDYCLTYWAPTPMSADTVASYRAQYPTLSWTIGQRTEVTSEANTECEAGHDGDSLDLIASRKGQLFVGKYDPIASWAVRPTEVDFAIPYNSD